MKLKAKNKEHLLELLDQLKDLVKYMEDTDEYVITMNEREIIITPIEPPTSTTPTGWYVYPNGGSQYV